MQGKLLAVALCAAFPLAAMAQSNVQVYGLLDAALAKEDTGAGSRTLVNAGNQSSNRFGFKGTEDLGNGLKAVFNIEGGFAVDTGKGDDELFGRRAVVGLSGGFGSILIGREYTPIADVAKETDVLGQGFYGNNLNSFGSQRLTRRISHSVNYKSNSMGGFKVGAAYAAGEKSSGPSGDLLGFSAQYAGGGFYVGAGYQVFERLATGDDKEMIVGAGYKFGAFDLKASYAAANPTGANNKFEQTNLGASFTMNAHKFFANLQASELETGAEAKGIAIAYSYTLSKRTNVYASYATLNNNAMGTFTMNAASTKVTPSAAGADPKALSLGVRHAF